MEEQLMSVQFQAVFIFLTSLGVAVILMPRLARIGTQVGLVDRPNSRKVHRRAKPLVGGLGMILAFAMSCILYVPLTGMRGFFAGVVLLFVIGFLDDYKELGHRWKFVGQVVAALLMISLSDVYLSNFGNLLYFGDIHFGLLALPLTVFCIVGLTNAINMIDGLDGLAGSIALVAFIAFAILSYMGEQWNYFFIALALGGAALGFLRYNWRPAKIFMGDAGSLFLGFALVYLSIIMTQGASSFVRPVVPLLILAVPITDTITLMVKRAMAGKSPFHADSYHLHHILIRMGLSKRMAVVSILLVSTLFALTAILGTLFSIPDYYLFLTFMVYFTVYFATSFYLKQILRLLRRSRVRARMQLVMMKN
jgi:UDP-GlcNAc:undecaprenyl-phosphate GlcNAc-1-phosphate transferase